MVDTRMRVYLLPLVVLAIYSLQAVSGDASSLYEVLGLGSDASQQEIKQAYRGTSSRSCAAMEPHPPL